MRSKNTGAIKVAELIQQLQVEAVAESYGDTRNRQLATMQWQDILAFADAEVKGKVLFKKFIAGTPLENDIPVWMAEYAAKYQQAAIKASGAEHIAGLVAILNETMAESDGCELNMSNYHHDDVHNLNNAYVALFQGIELALQALPPELRGK